MEGDKNLYGYAIVTCLKKMKLPLYERALHYQGKKGGTYSIECHDEGELDYYRDLARRIPEEVFFGGLRTSKYDTHRNVIDASFFGGISSDGVPNAGTVSQGFAGKLHLLIDGKGWFDELPVRNHYDCGSF